MVVVVVLVSKSFCTSTVDIKVLLLDCCSGCVSYQFSVLLS
jgi:hypothetical protein